MFIWCYFFALIIMENNYFREDKGEDVQELNSTFAPLGTVCTEHKSCASSEAGLHTTSSCWKSLRMSQQ